MLNKLFFNKRIDECFNSEVSAYIVDIVRDLAKRFPEMGDASEICDASSAFRALGFELGFDYRKRKFSYEYFDEKQWDIDYLIIHNAFMEVFEPVELMDRLNAEVGKLRSGDKPFVAEYEPIFDDEEMALREKFMRDLGIEDERSNTQDTSLDFDVEDDGDYMQESSLEDDGEFELEMAPTYEDEGDDEEMSLREKLMRDFGIEDERSNTQDTSLDFDVEDDGDYMQESSLEDDGEFEPKMAPTYEDEGEAPDAGDDDCSEFSDFSDDDDDGYYESRFGDNSDEFVGMHDDGLGYD